ncbi:MAG TPA: transposase [Thermoanaerobaculia bacterium]|nr:transposase [Thermoanaerobaculia bacterium]
MHRLKEAGAYCVTASTYLKQRFFHRRSQMDMLEEMFFTFATKFDWRLHAWSLFPNHYHFVGFCERPERLSPMLNAFHSATSRELNRLEGQPRRRVWFQFWDTQLTFPGSYMARLKYVQENPVHHNVVQCATEYRWCSASWFEKNAPRTFYNAIRGTKIDRVTIFDDFQSGGMAAAVQKC